MSDRTKLDGTRRSWRAAAVLWIAAFLACVPPMVLAQPAPSVPQQEPPSLGTDELKSLIGTLEDEQARKAFVGQLRALLAAREATAKPEAPSAGARAIAVLSDRIEAISRGVVSGASAVMDAPRLVDWIERQATDPAARARWVEIVWKLAVVLIAGFAAHAVVAAGLGGARRAIEARGAAPVWLRIAYVTVRIVLELAPVAAFAGAAYVTLPLLEPSASTRLVALALVNAVTLASAIVAFARIVLVPATPALRLLPLDEEDASYAYVWVRRLVDVSVYGYFLAEVALLLGLPRGGHAALVKIIGFVVALLVLVLVLQVRAPISAWLRGRRETAEGAREGTLAGIRARLGEVWHVVAILYVAGMYGVWVFEIRDGFNYVAKGTVLTLVILVAAHYAAQATRRCAARMFAISDDLKSRFPGLEARANRYLAVLQGTTVAVIYIIATFALLDAWGVDSFGWLATDLGQRVTGRAIVIASVLIATAFAWEILNAFIERLMRRRTASGLISQRALTLLPLLRTVALGLLVLLAGLTVLSELGVDIAPLLAGAGVVGLAIGFGSQTLVKDLVTGVFILSEDQIAVGDVVNVADRSGLVEALTIRTIRLRGLDGNVHVIPYSEVKTVENMTKDYSRYVLDVGVAYREDTDRVVEVLKELGAELQKDPEFGSRILAPIEILGVDRFADSAVIVRARLMTRPIEQWNVGREFNRRMKKRFDELGIEIPFPTRTVYFGVDQTGNASAARTRFESQPTGAESGKS
jgi:small conductance mechanosensitive channel